MTPRRFFAVITAVFVCGQMFAQTQDMDTALTKLADNVAAQIKDHGNKKVTVLDFTDLQGGSSELGRYVAEELTVNLVMGKHDFAVLDRANLKSILAEHKLTAEGLVNPDNAKKLGQFAGVDALIIGNIIPKGSNVDLTVKIITTDTAEIVGAAKAQFGSDATAQQFLSSPVAESKSGDDASGPKDLPAVVKSFGDLKVELQSLHIVSGHLFTSPVEEFILTMQLTNRNPKKSLWVAVNTDMGSAVQATLTDPGGNEFKSYPNRISGVAYTAYEHGGFFQATEIQPNDSTVATMKFVCLAGINVAPGTCRLQLELLVGQQFANGFGHATVQNLVTKIEAN